MSRGSIRRMTQPCARQLPALLKAAQRNRPTGCTRSDRARRLNPGDNRQSVRTAIGKSPCTCSTLAWPGVAVLRAGRNPRAVSGARGRTPQRSIQTEAHALVRAAFDQAVQRPAQAEAHAPVQAVFRRAAHRTALAEAHAPVRAAFRRAAHRTALAEAHAPVRGGPSPTPQRHTGANAPADDRHGSP
jgi:hypothetical protein